MGDRIDEQTRDVIFRVKRGLCAYVSYLAACEMNQAFSEYVLYEPILRILTACGYRVQCEYICPGIQQPPTGDRKRLDFYGERDGANFAMEVKWLTSTRLNVAADTEKLVAYHRATESPLAFLLVFGRRSHVENLDLERGVYREHGTPVYADLRKTRYGCRVFRVRGHEA